MAESSKNIRYTDVAEELRLEIISGKFQPGDKFYSRSQIAARCGISEPTAVRVQNILAKYGYIRKVVGGGCYVNFVATPLAAALEMQQSEKISRIVEFRFGPGAKYEFPKRFYRELDSILEKNPFPYTLKIYTPAEVSNNTLSACGVEPGTGYLVVSQGALTMLYCGHILFNPTVHSVLVDSVVPGSDCVITDSFDGMEKIVDYVFSKGCGRFIFAKNFVKSLGDFYNEERAYGAVYHCRRRGKECIVVDSGSFGDLLKLIRSSKEKTAVIFPQDTEAVRLQQILEPNELKRLVITGFDDYVEFKKPSGSLTTITIDHRKIMETAVSLLREGSARRKRIVRVPGKLIVRN
ncbi:MAG: Bacterial regulatory proteins, gntR family [Lentisphaerae bacterium ADurb.Bin242]|nr:MAG: Bacterial regulatory proteins, gntR family [Lentisphaerae bacterium ADurb.Bin242]